MASRVREFDDTDGKVFEFGDACGPQTTRSGYDFVKMHGIVSSPVTCAVSR